MKQLFILLLSISAVAVSAQCDHPDYAGLMELYESTGGDNWQFNNGWKEGKAGTSCDPCDFNGDAWAFINCVDGRVNGIYFLSNNLQGVVPNFTLSELEEFSIKDNNIVAVPDFSNTPELKKISFDNTAMSGPIPEFNKDGKIESLELSYCSLTGEIDDGIFPDLIELKLTNNNLSGELPSFNNLQKLNRLNLRVNELEGSIPNFNLPELTYLDLYDNQLTGDLPSFENLPRLNAISIAQNQLEGEVHNFENSPNINFIELSFNKFTGPLPDFKDHPWLISLIFQAQSNDFSGCIPDSYCENAFTSIRFNNKLPWRGDAMIHCDPESLINVPCSPSDSTLHGLFDFNSCECIPVGCEFYEDDYQVLKTFFSSANGELWTRSEGWREGFEGLSCSPCDYPNAGSFSTTWYGIKCKEGRVVAIDLDGTADFTQVGVGGNNLTGALPALDLDKLEELFLDDNLLGGELPSLENANSLETFIISRNHLDGDLSELENAKSLKVFRGSFNNFTGPIPDLSELDSLETFTCSNNMLEGCLDTALCNISLVDVRFNEALPWSGELDLYCNGELQIGAPCNLMEEEDYVINEDCECVLSISSQTEDHLTSISIYPNPANNYLNINTVNENSIFTIYDAQSNKVLESSDTRIDISELTSGLYFIKIFDSDTVLKFIKFN